MTQTKLTKEQCETLKRIILAEGARAWNLSVSNDGNAIVANAYTSYYGKLSVIVDTLTAMLVETESE